MKSVVIDIFIWSCMVNLGFIRILLLSFISLESSENINSVLKQYDIL